MKEKQQLLRDPDVIPTAGVIADCLGTTNNTYTKFIGELNKYELSLMDWRYYNDGKAWLTKGQYKWVTTRGTNKVKPIFWLSIWEGFFKVTFFFSEKIRAEMLTLPISQEATEIIKKAKPMGKTMRFIPIVFDISEDKQLGDIYVLAQVRKENL